MHGSTARRSRNPFHRALALAAVLASGCGSLDVATNSAPGLSGVWDLSFAAAGSTCSVPAGRSPGCGGSGRLTLSQSGEIVTGTVALSASCQSCGLAVDLGSVVLPVAGRLRGDAIELSLMSGCRLVARVAGDGLADVTGEATCSYDRIPLSGTWRMSRAE